MDTENHGGSVTEILAAIEAYVRGLREADIDALRIAFDYDGAIVAFSNDGQVTYSPVGAAAPRWISAGALQPTDVSSRVIGIHSAGEALCVAICELRLRAAHFRDVLTLARIGADWKIVSKTFMRVS